MDESTKNYRKGEIEGLSRYKDESYRVKVTGSGTETKWLTITNEELETIKGILSGDAVNTALHILNRAGYAVRTVGAEDVHEVLNAYMHDNTSGIIDTEAYRDEITRHVMEGDDWEGVLDTHDVTSYLWDVVEGTNNDHPEWFPEIRPADPFGEDSTPDLMDEYIHLYVCISAASLTHTQMGRFVNLGAELRERGVIN